MAVDNHGLAAIFGGPVVADRKPKFIGFPCGFTVKREVAHCAGAAPLHGLFHARVGDNQASAIKDIVAYEIVNEFGNLASEFLGFSFKLFQ